MLASCHACILLRLHLVMLRLQDASAALLLLPSEGNAAATQAAQDLGVRR